MEFHEIFQQFLERRNRLKVVFVASCDESERPNCAPKMLVDIVRPNKVFYIDFKYSRTFSNLYRNWQASLSFMDDKNFTGFRLNGYSQVLDSRREYEVTKEKWLQKVVAYEAERMIERIRGVFSTRQSEITLPDDFVIVKFIAEEAAIVKPDRVLRAMRKGHAHPINRVATLQKRISELEGMEKRRKAAEGELKRSRDLLRKTVNGIHDPVMVIDTDYRVVLANDAVKEGMLGQAPPGDLYCYRLSHHRDSPCEGPNMRCPLKEVMESCSPVSMVHTHYNVFGEETFVELNAAPIFDEEGRLVRIIEACHDITEHVKTERRLEEGKKSFEKKNLEDELTGLYNRRGFVTLVDQQIKLARRSGRPCFVIFSDVDHLKPINDRFGHKAGDRALVAAAGVLKKSFRESDIIGRVGGDEFAVAVIDCPESQLESVRERFRRNVAAHRLEAQSLYPFGMSLGMSFCKLDSPSGLEDLLDHADRMAYERSPSPA